MRPRHALLAILVYSVATVWVRERWALSALEALCFLCAAGLLCRRVAGARPLRGSWLVLPLAGMCAWALLQGAAGWSEVRSETADAARYWLTAACLVWIASEVCRHSPERSRFLAAFLAAGSAVALLGVVQLYTSGGKIFWLFPSGYDTMVIGPFVSPNNYAAFVELLVPLALALALGSRRQALLLVLAAALVASVIASGSRAGTFLVIAESAAVFALDPRPDSARPRVLVMFLAAAGAFTAIVGCQFLWHRLVHSGDLLLVRREFLESSLAMIRAHPLRGFGMGTWPAVYPRFAVIDTGVAANHAHNEWVQWAAEGGAPALLLMLAVLALTVRAAIRTGWGIGILAVLLHSLVDYPFLRLGSAAWTFALLGALAGAPHGRPATSGMAPNSRGEPRTSLPLRLAAAALALTLVLAAIPALRLAWADALSRRGTVSDLERAIRLCPDRAEFHAALGDLDPAAAAGEWRRAIALNPGLTSLRVRLAGELEARGDPAAAEALVLEAARYDRRFLPAWTAANFYFRRGRTPEFWVWARRAADWSYDDLGALFNLCFRVTGDAAEVAARLAPRRREIERNFLSYLSAAGRFDDAAAVAGRLAHRPAPEDRDVLLSYIEAAHAAGRAGQALHVWRAMCRAGLMADPGTNLVDNGDFRREPTGRAFDWRLPPVAGVRVARDTRREPALLISFSGEEPEHGEFLAHPLAVEPGAAYVMRCRYRTIDLPASPGLYWSLGDAREFPLDASGEWRTAEWRFIPSAEAPQLALRYRRVEGSTRIEGALVIASVTLERENGRLTDRRELKFQRRAAD